ncbi:MAG: hypothetical protein LBU11_12705 [Zoogloeaceae bacterium]|jgi:hypothetical protein|nr:hypothetical protein [Zoogloeaceae bacterium]
MTNISHHLILTLFVLVASSCSAANAMNRDVCPDRSSDDYYFARGALRPGNPDLDRFIRDWFSEQLAAMDEPSISCGKPDVYRFTWLRTFHHPVAVRIAAQGDSAILYAVELDGAGGYAPGKVLRKIERTLSSSEFKDLKILFPNSQFSLMPTTEDRAGFDGSEWILEQSGEAGYHLVVRRTPENGAVRDIGNLFLSFTGWTFEKVY